MTRAAIYCRISRDSEGKALGVARQESDCRDYAQRRGWGVADVLVDNDVSAYGRRRRPSYERLIEGIKAGEYDALIVWHPDRLHRRPAELEEFIDVVESTSIDIGTCTAGDWDLSTPDGRLMARIVGSVARKESEDKSRRLRRKHQEIADAGQVSGGGRRPFGFESDRCTIRESEAAEIRGAVERVIAGESVRSIAVDWNDRGVATVTGTHWSSTTVKRLLSSARIAGHREHQGKLTPAVWPAIVDLDDVTRVRSRLARPTSPTGRTPRKYLLTGLLRCGRCESLMTTRPVTRKGHHYARYICSTDRGGCGRCGISGERLDEFIAAAVIEALDSPQLAEMLSEPTNDESGPTGELVDLEDRRTDLAAMFARGEITRPEWLAARDAIDAKIVDHAAQVNDSSVHRELARLTADVVELRDQWPTLTLGRRRAIVESVVSFVVIAPTDRSNNRFDPDRVSITWRA